MKKNVIGILFLLIPLAAAAVLYFLLPEQIPMKFSLTTLKATRYMHKGYIFLISLIPFLVYLKYRGKK